TDEAHADGRPVHALGRALLARAVGAEVQPAHAGRRAGDAGDVVVDQPVAVVVEPVAHLRGRARRRVRARREPTVGRAGAGGRHRLRRLARDRALTVRGLPEPRRRPAGDADADPVVGDAVAVVVAAVAALVRGHHGAGADVGAAGPVVGQAVAV